MKLTFFAFSVFFSFCGALSSAHVFFAFHCKQKLEISFWLRTKIANAKIIASFSPSQIKHQILSQCQIGNTVQEDHNALC